MYGGEHSRVGDPGYFCSETLDVALLTFEIGLGYEHGECAFLDADASDLLVEVLLYPEPDEP